jgi:TDG/mug DNA glycosylase family protein
MASPQKSRPRVPPPPGEDRVGLDPVAGPASRVLVLGSMPGNRSLQEARYYAHPHNAFWPAMGRVCGIDPTSGYGERLRRLRQAGVALWDVVGRCRRFGSLDRAIESESIVINDFGRLFEECRGLAVVFCNGGLAFDLYRRRVQRELVAPFRDLPVHRLPSTSPAYAAMRMEQKVAVWADALRPWLGPPAA